MILIHDKQKIAQPNSSYALHATGSDPISMKNITTISGGLLLQEISKTPGEITLEDIGNFGNDHGQYGVMVWAPKGFACPKLRWVQNDKTLRIHQSMNQAAMRGKIMDAVITGVHFVGKLDANKHPIKQVVQVRHGKWEFDGCTFEDSFLDVGQQKTEQPGGGSVYEAEQHISLLTFNQCIFPLFAPGGLLPFLRHPGVDKIVINKCIGPDGKTFSKTL